MTINSKILRDGLNGIDHYYLEAFQETFNTIDLMPRRKLKGVIPQLVLSPEYTDHDENNTRTIETWLNHFLINNSVLSTRFLGSKIAKRATELRNAADEAVAARAPQPSNTPPPLPKNPAPRPPNTPPPVQNPPHPLMPSTPPPPRPVLTSPHAIANIPPPLPKTRPPSTPVTSHPSPPPVKPATVTRWLNDDLRIYPAPDNNTFPHILNQTTYGDLHGNTLTLIHLLIKQHFLTLPNNSSTGTREGTYQRLLDIYDTLNSVPPQRAKTLITEFKTILNNSTFNPNAGALRLIGDVLGDRGENDYLTLLVLNKLKEKRIPVEILYSNHDAAFLESRVAGQLNNELKAQIDNAAQYYRNNRHAKKTPFITSLSAPDPNDPPGRQDASLQNMGRLINEGAIDTNEVDRLVADYMPLLKAIGYTANLETKHITLYTHAPVGLKTLKRVASDFKIDFKDQTIEQLCDTIDAINAAVSKLSLLDLNKKLLDTNCGLHWLIWNRPNTGQDEFDSEPIPHRHQDYAISLVHGHNTNPNKKYSSSGYKEPERVKHIHNLDNRRAKGKGIYNGDYSTHIINISSQRNKLSMYAASSPAATAPTLTATTPITTAASPAAAATPAAATPAAITPITTAASPAAAATTAAATPAAITPVTTAASPAAAATTAAATPAAITPVTAATPAATTPVVTTAAPITSTTSPVTTDVTGIKNPLLKALPNILVENWKLNKRATEPSKEGLAAYNQLVDAQVQLDELAKEIKEQKMIYPAATHPLVNAWLVKKEAELQTVKAAMGSTLAKPRAPTLDNSGRYYYAKPYKHTTADYEIFDLSAKSDALTQWIAKAQSDYTPGNESKLAGHIVSSANQSKLKRITKKDTKKLSTLNHSVTVYPEKPKENVSKMFEEQRTTPGGEVVSYQLGVVDFGRDDNGNTLSDRHLLHKFLLDYPDRFEILKAKKLKELFQNMSPTLDKQTIQYFFELIFKNKIVRDKTLFKNSKDFAKEFIEYRDVVSTTKVSFKKNGKDITVDNMPSPLATQEATTIFNTLQERITQNQIPLPLTVNHIHNSAVAMALYMLVELNGLSAQIKFAYTIPRPSELQIEAAGKPHVILERPAETPEEKSYSIAGIRLFSKKTQEIPEAEHLGSLLDPNKSSLRASGIQTDSANNTTRATMQLTDLLKGRRKEAEEEKNKPWYKKIF